MAWAGCKLGHLCGQFDEQGVVCSTCAHVKCLSCRSLRALHTHTCAVYSPPNMNVLSCTALACTQLWRP